MLEEKQKKQRRKKVLKQPNKIKGKKLKSNYFYEKEEKRQKKRLKKNRKNKIYKKIGKSR